MQGLRCSPCSATTKQTFSLLHHAPVPHTMTSFFCMGLARVWLVCFVLVLLCNVCACIQQKSTISEEARSKWKIGGLDQEESETIWELDEVMRTVLFHCSSKWNFTSGCFSNSQHFRANVLNESNEWKLRSSSCASRPSCSGRLFSNSTCACAACIGCPCRPLTNLLANTPRCSNVWRIPRSCVLHY
jgi:hypothetical protein